ncbi:MAG: hypothetical protein FWC60_08245 [Firmicutes bacterium]|nr:hypothetical protein [Bacillota bacterium]
MNATLAAQMINFLILLLLIYSIVYFLLIRPKRTAQWHARQADREERIIERLDKIIAMQEEQRQKAESPEHER